jgi:SlyX protein
MDLTPIEERLAHLERVADDLSDVVARQDRVIERLLRQVAALVEREAEREDESRRAAPVAPPPHW